MNASGAAPASRAGAIRARGESPANSTRARVPQAGLQSSARNSVPSAAARSNDALRTLNDRLKGLDTSADVDYRPKHIKIGDAEGVIDSAISAYEASLAPSADILRRTFGFIYERRVSGHPDSIAYVFDTYSIGPVTMCKAWKAVEHPYQPVGEVGPGVRSAGIGGGVTTNDNSSVVRHDNGGRAEASVVQFPCTQKSYTAVTPGSLMTPLPRHPDLVQTPSAGATP